MRISALHTTPPAHDPIVVLQLADLQDYTWRLQLYSELEDLKQGMQLAVPEDGSFPASSGKPECSSSDQVPAPGSNSADTQLQEPSCSCMTTPADAMVHNVTGCCPPDASEPCSTVQELHSQFSISGASGHAPAAAKDPAGPDKLNPASHAPATDDGDALGSPYSIEEDLQQMEAMMESLQVGHAACHATLLALLQCYRW
jgi:hypothetical protein